jgi:hypothetical protein
MAAREPILPVYAGSDRTRSYTMGSDDAIGVCKHGLRRKNDNTGTATMKQDHGDCSIGHSSVE